MGKELDQSTNQQKIRGYKALDSNFRCKNVKFEVGTRYVYESSIKLGVEGFHFCKEPVFINNYYNWLIDKTTRFAEIEASGDIQKGKDEAVTKTIKILAEIPRTEFIKLCTGGPFLDFEGNKYWYKTGRLHRDTDATTSILGRKGKFLSTINDRLPAIEYTNGDKMYYIMGKLHRSNGLPAMEYSNGNCVYYEYGKLHRLHNLPAVDKSRIKKDQDTGLPIKQIERMYFTEGKLHRENDEPAIEYFNGDKYWYFRGKRHRDEDKPAVIFSNGDAEYWQYGERHRQHGPAMKYRMGEAWYKRGKLHRITGPAIEHRGEQQFWIKGKRLTRAQWLLVISLTNNCN